jgi:hypothetical protein
VNRKGSSAFSVKALKRCITRRDFIPASAIYLLLSLKLSVHLYPEVDFPPCPAKWLSIILCNEILSPIAPFGDRLLE